MKVFLTTERLVLRQFDESDVDNLVELDSDPEVMRYLTGGRPTPRATVRDELLPWLLAKYDTPGGYAQWAAEERADRRLRRLVRADPQRSGRTARRGRARLPAAARRLGEGLRHRGLAGPDPHRVHRAGDAPDLGADDGRQHRVPPGDGAVRPAIRPRVPPDLGRSDRGRRARRGRVRTAPRRMGRSSRFVKFGLFSAVLVATVRIGQPTRTSEPARVPGGRRHTRCAAPAGAGSPAAGKRARAPGRPWSRRCTQRCVATRWPVPPS